MNIAQRIIETYASDDFKFSYMDALEQTLHSNEANVVKRIEELFNIFNYETVEYFGHKKAITSEQAKRIFNYVSENIDSFVTEFNGYYVGHTSLESVAFGEQETQLSDVYNSKTGKHYNRAYLREVLNDEGFYVKEEYAYYNVDGGLHVDLCHCKDEINAIINA